MHDDDSPEHDDIRRPWSRSDRPVPRAVVRPVQEFMHRETSGGIVLAVAAIVALLWANLDYRSYYDTWHTHVAIRFGSFAFDESLLHVINDGLMALFFFVIGMEIKREVVHGELRDRRAAMLPVFGALGGMLVPAGLYVVVTQGSGFVGGWGVPMATDIAFALGVLALLGSRVPLELKVLLLGIAVIDDIGAIVVIALFYGSGVQAGWLLGAVAALALVSVATRLEVRATPVYVVLGLAAWFATFESGVHATIAGVLLGLLVPSRPFQDSDAVSEEARRIADETSSEHDPEEEADAWRRLAWLSREAIAPMTRAERALHPWTSYVVLPLFALANVGVVIDAAAAGEVFTTSVGIGIVLGLVVGKPAGILLGCALAVRTGIATLPDAVGWRHVAGVGAVSGIGFTVALFITTLAFEVERVVTIATLAVIIASVVSGIVGAVLLLSAPTRR